VVADYPAELATIVDRCLTPARELRFRDAEELRSALVALLITRGWAASPADLTLFLRGLFGDRAPPWQDDPPTVIAELPRPKPALVDDEPTVIARAFEIGDAKRLNVPAAPPSEETTTVTEWPPAPAPARPPALPPPPAPSVHPVDGPWLPLPVAIAFTLATLIALGLAARFLA
jgi:hypothetical protein